MQSEKEITIIIRNGSDSNEVFNVMVPPDVKIVDLEESLSEQKQIGKNSKIELFKSVFDGWKTLDSGKTMQESQIQNGDTLYFRIVYIPIVEEPIDEEITIIFSYHLQELMLRVSSLDITLSELESVLKEAFHLRPNSKIEFYLRFETIPLDVTQTLREHGIRKGGVLFIKAIFASEPISKATVRDLRRERRLAPGQDEYAMVLYDFFSAGCCDHLLYEAGGSIETYIKNQPSSIDEIEYSNTRIKTKCQKPTKVAQNQNCGIASFRAKPSRESFSFSETSKIIDINTDKRQLSTATNKFPNSVHGFLKVELEGDQHIFGTGILIGENLVLTAAHNIWDKSHSKVYPEEKIKFYPGMNGKNLPFGSAAILKMFVPQLFQETSGEEEPSDDFALLILDRPIGAETGYFGLDIAGKDVLKNKKISVVGYPYHVQDQEYQKLIYGGCYFQFGMSGFPIFDEENPNIIEYDIFTSSGQSGSGVFYHDDENDLYYVIGIHVMGLGEINRATWITNTRFKQIKDWIGMCANDLRSIPTSLEISQVSMTSEKIEEELVRLDLNYSVHKVDDDDLKIFSKYELGRLGIVNLNENEITDKGAKILGENTTWTKLEELYLSENRIGDRGGSMIATNTSWKNLRVLDLSKNQIGDEGDSSIGSNTSWTKLVKLDLSENKIDDRSAAMIASNTSWKNLRVLDLSKNQIGDEGDSSIGSNTSWTKLEELYLSENRIGDRGASMIASNTSWKNLKVLDLSRNLIGDEGASSIGRNKSWEFLKKLNLSSNYIGKKGAEVVIGNDFWIHLDELIFYGQSTEEKRKMF